MCASEAVASCARVGKFMAAKEVATQAAIQASDDGCVKVEFQNAHFSWSHEGSCSTSITSPVPMTLKDITLTLVPKTLTIVVGPVGSGKSSLVSAILGEIHQVGGTRTVAGRVAYANQEAWIQHATLQNNILFTADMHADKYDRVLSACQLKPDLAMLPDGDQTEIGERGINLSGGQKARVSLARAMYRSDAADLILLDDPLSALDVHVAGAVFRECVQGMLQDKTVVLVLNSHYHFLPHADRVVVMEDGAIVGDGSFDSIKDAFPHLMSSSDKVDASPPTHAATQPTVSAQVKGGELMTKEERRVGNVMFATYASYFSASGWNQWLVVAAIAAAYTLSQADLTMADWFMGYWAKHPGNNGSSTVTYVVLAAMAMVLVWGRSLFVLLS
ncbi:hypothetical protein H310_14570 [Aphanomyces invadans]|uniref:ABC transporter domain-containing protein n=1 Tax=Aphanomyces invadans TaxID=157072 RepID=A0A024TAN0_9STRA|nr:hypothetical protein H310_14570 [Aphanomyces invadans]ETV90676.1 hypothetical protein H310_14570 [Aphanomyces invadans]|eukprot:XP_008880673.1 hypothetical protein H310_14570 [Aphanomyces invadans]